MHAALVVHARRPDHRAAALHVPAGAARHRLCLAPPRSVVRRGGASARVQTAPRTARRLGTNRRRRNPQLPAPPQRPRGRVASQVCPVPLPPGRRVLYLACRIDHGVAVRNDGRVVTWGSIAADRDSPTDAGYVSVACGQSHSLALHRDGRVVTLGRGGSDLTATALGAALKDCHEVQVWKDVDGMMSADPRVVRNAVPVPFATYDEAAELAYFGAQLLHPVSMQPALRAGLPVRIKNSYNPDHPGTLISSKEDSCLSKQCLVTAITSKRDITLVDVVSLRSVGQSGFLAAVFNTLERHGVSVDVVATSEVSVSLTLDKKTTVPPAAVRDLESFAQVQVRRNRAIVSLVGNNIKRESTHLVALAFAALDKRDKHVEMISQGASKVAVALVIEDDCADEVVTLLHDAFFDDVGTDTSSWSGPDVAERDAADAPRQKTAAIAAAERMAAR
mmetsp:Transcript_3691/g.14444  ORF Transcript_3691/g.14444 Transcript_3691/m.14444 type:complete len:448 (+) Transcript_3691:134-1477(+)